MHEIYFKYGGVKNLYIDRLVPMLVRSYAKKRWGKKALRQKSATIHYRYHLQVPLIWSTLCFHSLLLHTVVISCISNGNDNLKRYWSNQELWKVDAKVVNNSLVAVVSTLSELSWCVGYHVLCHCIYKYTFSTSASYIKSVQSHIHISKQSSSTTMRGDRYYDTALDSIITNKNNTNGLSPPISSLNAILTIIAFTYKSFQSQHPT